MNVRPSGSPWDSPTGTVRLGVPATAAFIAVILLARARTGRLYAEAARREAAEAALRQSQRLEALGQLTGGVAHDFNNLLMIIGGAAQQLRNQPLGDRARRSVAMIETASERAVALTGKLLSFARRRTLAISPETIEKSDIHIHVPAGATPKDGPSAGVAMFVALASLLTNRPVRNDVAMTGEISLRGLVLPIGGVKEKVLAAQRAGITIVMLPKRNERDLDEVPKDVREQLTVHLIKRVDEILPIVLDPGDKPPPSLKAPPTDGGSEAAL